MVDSGAVEDIPQGMPLVVCVPSFNASNCWWLQAVWVFFRVQGVEGFSKQGHCGSDRWGRVNVSAVLGLNSSSDECMLPEVAPSMKEDGHYSHPKDHTGPQNSEPVSANHGLKIQLAQVF